MKVTFYRLSAVMHVAWVHGNYFSWSLCSDPKYESHLLQLCMLPECLEISFLIASLSNNLSTFWKQLVFKIVLGDIAREKAAVEKELSKGVRIIIIFDTNSTSFLTPTQNLYFLTIFLAPAQNPCFLIIIWSTRSAEGELVLTGSFFTVWSRN